MYLSLFSWGSNINYWRVGFHTVTNFHLHGYAIPLPLKLDKFWIPTILSQIVDVNTELPWNDWCNIRTLTALRSSLSESLSAFSPDQNWMPEPSSKLEVLITGLSARSPFTISEESQTHVDLLGSVSAPSLISFALVQVSVPFSSPSWLRAF